MKSQLEEGQLVLCTVDRIVGTIVFVKIDEFNAEGTITFPEIAPGRIRNIRDYAFPGKKIICKVLRIHQNSVELSFRRVKLMEKNEFNEALRHEKSFCALLRTILKDKAESTIEKIKAQMSIPEFVESVKENPKILENFFDKEQAAKIAGILSEKKTKETTLSRKFNLSSKASNGMILVKEIIQSATKDISKENSEVSYIAAGKYLLKLKTKDLKSADTQLNKALEQIESQAKQKSCFFNQEKD